VAVGVGPAGAKNALPSTLPLPPAWQPEGIAIKDHRFYAGSIPTGSVYLTSAPVPRAPAVRSSGARPPSE
jgi:hypothetical protein